MARRQFWFWGLAAAALFITLWALKGMLLPFVIGLAAAYLLDPVVDRISRLGLNRTASVSFVLLAFVAFFAGVVALVFPVLQGQFLRLLAALPGYVQQMREGLAPWIESLQQQVFPEGGTYKAEDILGHVPQGTSGYAAQALGWAGGALQRLWNGGVAVFDILSILIVAPVVSFYMLRDWDVLVARVDGWLPRRHAATIRALVTEMDIALSGFIRGQALVCLALGILYGVGLTLAGLEFGFLIGFAAGVLSFIPYLGSVFGFVTALVVAWFQYNGFGEEMIPVVVVFGVGQFLEGNYLTPKLVGEKVGLHALWVLFALMAGGSLMGFTGVMIAVPVAAVVAVLVRFMLRTYLASPYYTDRQGIPASASPEKKRAPHKPQGKRG